MIDHLALAQLAVVALLAVTPLPTGLLRELLQVRDVLVECRAGDRACGPQAPLLFVRLGLAGEHLAHVAGAGTCRGCAAVDDQLVGQFWIQVCPPVRESRGHLLKSRHGRVDQLGRRPQAVQEQVEEAVQDGARIGHRIPLPCLPVGVDQSSAEGRDGQVTVNAVVQVQLGLIDGLESGEPLGGLSVAAQEGIGGQIVELFVVIGQSEVAARHRGI